MNIKEIEKIIEKEINYSSTNNIIKEERINTIWNQEVKYYIAVLEK